MTIDKPDSLVSMKVSKGGFDALIESGKFTDLDAMIDDFGKLDSDERI